MNPGSLPILLYMNRAAAPQKPKTPRAFTPDFWLAYAANVLVMTVVALFYRFGDLVNKLGGTDQMLGLVVATGSLCGVVARTRLTALTARFNLHLVWMASVVSMTAGAAVVTGAAAFAEPGHVPPLLVLGRILFAAGAAGGLGLPIVFVQKTTAAEHRGEAVGFVSGGVFVGMMLGAGLSELLFQLSAPESPLRYTALFGTAMAAGAAGVFCVAIIRWRDAPLVYEALPKQAPPADAPADAANEASKPRYALLTLGLATGFAFTFCTVYLTRFLAVKKLGGYLTFFFAYCASAFLVSLATKSWGKLVGHYRMAIIGIFVNVFGTLLFLVANESWHLVFPAILCGLARAFANPALVGLAEAGGASERTVKGHATNGILLALDIGNFFAALGMGLLTHAFGYSVTLAVTAATVALAGVFFVATESAAGEGRNLRRRKDDFRSRRKSDYGDGQWQGAGGSRVSLVYVKKPSGIRLDGAWHQLPKASAGARPREEIVLMIHADGDDFCSPSILETLQNYYLEQGLPVLRVNTSGKGVINYYNVDTGAERYGTVYEVVDDCLGEIDTWFAWLQRQGYLRVTLVGHRLGAVKVLYYAANGANAGIVSRVVALSPPRLAHDVFLADDASGIFRADLAKAQALMRAGKPEAYFDARFPAPDLMSARSFLDKYGAEARYDVIRFLPRIKCPSLVLIGSLDERTLVTQKGLAKDLQQLCATCPALAVEVVAGANQYYSNAREKAVLAVDAWLRQNAAPDEGADEGLTAA